jgi:hypothetical protein
MTNGRTHAEHAVAVRPALSCTAHDRNFGGECFNCGWVPAVYNGDILPQRHGKAYIVGGIIENAGDRGAHAVCHCGKDWPHAISA